VTPELQQALDATLCTHLTYIVSRAVRPFTGNDFSEQFRAWCDAAELPARCSVHGLRYAAARRYADKGATLHQIAAMGGWKSLRMGTGSGKPFFRFAKNAG
jgi:hypothetical protein